MINIRKNIHILKKLFLLVFVFVFSFLTTVVLGEYYVSSFINKDLSCKNCNVILISIDTLRQDHLGIYGYDRNTSSNIDKFFRNGAVFLNHISQSALTIPSHMSLFTSLYPQQHEMMFPSDPPLKKSITTLAEILKKEGYLTAGLYNNHHLDPKYGFGRGFDIYLRKGADQDTIQYYLDKLIAGNNKFFLFLHPQHPHDPYIVERNIAEKFINSKYQGNIDHSPDSYLGLSPREKRDKFWKKVNKKSEEDIHHLINLYDAKLYTADKYLSAIFQKIRDEDLLKNTIIILLSDHGEAFGEHGKFKHSQLYDEIIKVPLLIKHPNKNKKIIINALSQNVDLMPTILDFLDIKLSHDISGKSLVKFIRQDVKLLDGLSISQFSETTAIRTSKWKLILQKEKSAELYNLETDPEEQENVFLRYPDIAISLEEKLSSILGEIKFDYPTPIEKIINEETKKRLINTGYF